MNYIYILECADHTLYTGWTTDIHKRLDAHNQDKGAKRTKGRGPLTLVYLESIEDKGDALRREMAIKKLSRKDKLSLIATNHSNTMSLFQSL